MIIKRGERIYVPEEGGELVHPACFFACQLDLAMSFTAPLYKFAPFYVG